MVSSAYNCRRGTRLLRLQNPICSSDFHHPVWSAGMRMINICNYRWTVKTEEKRFFTSLHHSRFKSQRRKCERHVLSRNPLCERCCVFRLHSRLVSLYRECLCLPDSHCIHSPRHVCPQRSHSSSAFCDYVCSASTAVAFHLLSLSRVSRWTKWDNAEENIARFWNFADD